jgi:hypothetical protein
MATEDDWDVELTEETPEEEAEPPLKYEIMNYPADFTLGGYVDLWEKDQLIVPDFQRQYVWDRVRASKLVESFLLGLPVPGVFLYKERNSPKYLIIDGQQRITSVVRYIKGTFDEGVFRLKNVDPRYEGKRFEDLSDEDKFKLKGTVLRATIIQQINPNDDTSIYHVFERLNTGGVNLNPMEVRQCVSYGPFVSRLKECNEVGAWREIIGQPKVDKRLRDVELVLRCMALAEDGHEYSKPMKGFLNEYMESQRGEDAEFGAMLDNFKDACDFVVSNLGPKPFHLRGRLNYGALDSVMAVLLAGARPANLKAAFLKLLADSAYEEATTFNTSDDSVVELRLSKAREALG